MKIKLLSAIAIILLLCVAFASCNEVKDNSSADIGQSALSDAPSTENSVNESTPEESLTETSIPDSSEPIESEAPVEISEEEVSEQEDVEPSIWYGDKELREWYLEYLAGFEENHGDELYRYTRDDKHYGFYHGLEGGLANAVTGKLFWDYIEIFKGTDDINLAAFCEYYDITVDEYKQVYAGDFKEFGTKLPGEKPDGRVMLYIQIHQYDAWFSEEYWNHPDLIIKDYIAPEIDDYYTSIADRDGYTRRYYRIDRLLIEHVGVDNFEKWLDEKENVDQNILNFIEYFEITKDTYTALYEKVNFKPYNSEYLFGTPEMQEEYFKVQPVDELGAIIW